MKTERMVILVTPEQKSAISARAKSLKLTVSEVVRRSVESYSPQADEALLNALADELEKSTKEARAALKDALKEANATLDYFAAKRKTEARRKAA